MQGLQAAVLAWVEVVGETEGGELREGLAKALELGFEVGGPRRERRTPALRWADGRPRLAQELAAVALVGRAIERDEVQSLAYRQGVLQSASKDLVLLGALQSG